MSDTRKPQHRMAGGMRRVAGGYRLMVVGILASASAVAAPPQTAGYGEAGPGIITVPLTGITVVSGGSGHTCASGAGGAMRCWGDNVYDQLGDGSFIEQLMPVAVVGLGGGARAIGAGGSHTCAVTTAGAAKCWAYNYHGQVGDGTDTDRDFPTQVVGLTSGVDTIGAGMIHSCALTTGGGVKCWGANGFGQLGDGSDTERQSPVDVLGLGSGVQAISTGGEHSCALTTGGGVKCWGANDYGQLGDNSTTERYAPVDVSGLGSGVQAISAGRFHTCAVTMGGAVKCWGANDDGQLGDATNTERHAPVDVSGLALGVQAIGTGYAHSCAMTSGGAVKCWGSNSWGQLGDGGSPGSLVPVDVSGLGSGAQSIGLGSDHSCAVVDGGQVKCWGSNQYGQLGNNSIEDAPTPVLVVIPDAIFSGGFE